MNNIYGRWKIIDGPVYNYEYGVKVKWFLCRCECGVERSVRWNSLRARKSQSCGCLQKERVNRGPDHPQFRHGHCAGGKKTKEWRAWNAMIRRCKYPSEDNFSRYGGAGITVCNQWQDSFECFLDEVGYAPSEKHSIDRIDHSGNYEPGNIRWATSSEQIINSSQARWIEFNGQTKTIGEWSSEIGINRQTIQMRLDKYNWSIERALTTPVRKRTK